MPLTVEDLRAYFERRVRESQEGMEQAAEKARKFKKGTLESELFIERHRILNSRRNLYQELIDIIDRGELPD
jgi:hypothetical protein